MGTIDFNTAVCSLVVGGASAASALVDSSSDGGAEFGRPAPEYREYRDAP